MLDIDVNAVIETVTDPAARPRLRRCLPFLHSALDRFNPRTAPGSLVLALATPNAAQVMSADFNWPDPASTWLTRDHAALALFNAIESEDVGDIEIVVSGLAVVLRADGIAAHRHDVEEIAALGLRPMLVALFERQDVTITLAITTVAVPLAGVTIH